MFSAADFVVVASVASVAAVAIVAVVAVAAAAASYLAQNRHIILKKTCCW